MQCLSECTIAPPLRIAQNPQALRSRQSASGGSIMITTSARTHPDAVRALTAALPEAWLHCWRPDDATNPYFGLLAWADDILVTSDSIAMISEALAVGVPVALFDLALHCDETLKTRAYRWLMRVGPARLTRDIGIAHTLGVNCLRSLDER